MHCGTGCVKKPSKHKSKNARSSRRAGVAARGSAPSGHTASRDPLHLRVPAPVPHTSVQGPALRSRAPYTISATYQTDDRQALVLLLLPFLLMAFAIGMGQALRPGGRFVEVTAARHTLRPIAVERVQAPSVAPAEAIKPAVTRPATTSPAQHGVVPPLPVLAAPVLSLPTTPPDLNLRDVETALARSDLRLPVELPAWPSARFDLQPPALSLPLAPPRFDLPDLHLAAPLMQLPVTVPIVTTFELALAPPTPRLDTSAPLLQRPEIAVPDALLRLPPAAPDFAPAASEPVQNREAGSKPPANVCVADARVGRSPPPIRAAAVVDPVQFGLALAAAARAQTREFVIYNDKYRRIAYPMGDVSSFYGVCTDVLVRAYRALGIDLQELVQTTRMGSGDPNIDHRRVDTLRRFFSTHGLSLPITDFAENFQPGDIVSYWRPQNRHSRTHIAIVADQVGPSGRPIIVHNRGWGPQIEDGLFVDRITGHYRFTGIKGAKAPPTLATPTGTLPRAAVAAPAGAAAKIGGPKLNGALPNKANEAPTPKPRAPRRQEAGIAVISGTQ